MLLVAGGPLYNQGTCLARAYLQKLGSFYIQHRNKCLGVFRAGKVVQSSSPLPALQLLRKSRSTRWLICLDCSVI